MGSAQSLPGRPSHQPRGRPPRTLRPGTILLQILFLLVVAALAGFLYANMIWGLERLGLTISFSFLRGEAGFGISEGIRYQLGDTYARAMWVGAVNTLRVSVSGVLLATLIGLGVGLGRLSRNWLIRKLAGLYVETLRNTPLLLQLTFWYTAVMLRLPPIRQSINIKESLFINLRGVYLPKPSPGPSFTYWIHCIALTLILSLLVYVWQHVRLRRVGRPGFPLLWSLFTLVLGVVGAWLVVPGPPITWELPVLRGFNFTGGMALSPEFVALLMGLSLYTGAFIAEVVRGGVQAVSKGQREAALSLGLKPWQVMLLVVLPQALRGIVPPLTSQYLNLFKNSSLAMAVGFPDLFSIGQTTLNQTGQSIPVFIIIMSAYLVMSLITSLLMNLYNRRVRLVER